HPDDDDGRPLRGRAPRPGLGDRLRAASPPRHRHRGRAHLQPDAHAVHDARDLPGLRPPGPAGHEAGEGIGGAGDAAGGGGMNLSTPFIHRPIATTLLTVAIALAGAIAYVLLPVSPLPQVEFPTINVGAGLPGASPETMASSVATPLERQFGRIAGVTE